MLKRLAIFVLPRSLLCQSGWRRISQLLPSKWVKKSAPKKKSTQVLARVSVEDATPSLGLESQVGVVYPYERDASLHEDLDAPFPPPREPTPTPVVETQEEVPEEVVRSRKVKSAATGPSLLDYDGRYLELPYTIPSKLEVSSDAPWIVRKFHYHAALNGTHVLARRADHRARANNQSFHQARYDELEQANAGDIVRMTEAFKKEKTIRDFLSSPNYEGKMGRLSVDMPPPSPNKGDVENVEERDGTEEPIFKFYLSLP
ncbi:hypothetical protein LIER_11890 [Lithospermum erythrorhizon]|uniref:Uncharacterized protein n=1 Tax=Lithospermum erythrorhizon TaxID=34254 RepID=A0AAV3PPR0_LITER